MNSLKTTGFVTISTDAMNLNRARARSTFNGDAQFRVQQQAIHRTTQTGGGRVLRKHRLEVRDNGQIKSYIVVFEYEDGSEERFDGQNWTKVPAPKNAPA